MVWDHNCRPLIFVVRFSLFTNIVPSVDSGLLAINFYTPSKFISPCLMSQIARMGVKLHFKKNLGPDFQRKVVIWSSWKRLTISTSEAVKRFQIALNIKLFIFWVRADEVFYNFDIICPKNSTTHCKNFIEKAQLGFLKFSFMF